MFGSNRATVVVGFRPVNRVGGRASRQLRRPAEAEVEAWRAEAEERFMALIVHPYVLVRLDDFGGEAPSV
ncbi:MAG: DUF2288 family protein [Myxococcales bacterium]|nr:MAG: DUF2288 family protein [Myxococcales bacterium]